MNPITYSLDNISNFDIPKAILNVAFTSRLAIGKPTLETLHARMKEEVIIPKVLTDCNLLHGTEITVPLARCERLHWDNFETVYRVPKELTQGKSIISILEITASSTAVYGAEGAPAFMGSGLYTNNMAGYVGMGAVVGAAKQMQDSVKPTPIMSNAIIYLVGENTFMLRDPIVVPSTMYVRMVVENDSNFNHIGRPYYPEFHRLCLLAVQMYIYNILVIEQDSVFISSGGELNKFRDIVEGFSDAAEIYREQLDTWYRCALLNDPESSRNYYQGVVGGAW